MFVSSLRQAINPQPITTTADTSVEAVIALMSRARTSGVLILDSQGGNGTQREQLIGIFTERDVVRMIAASQQIKGVAIGEVMTKNVLTLTESLTEDQDIVTVLTLFRQHRIRHLPVFDANGTLMGILTQQGIRTVLKPIDFMRLRRVAEVMITRVIHAPVSTTVLNIAKLMASYNVSCVVLAQADHQGATPFDSTWGVWSADSCQIKPVHPVGIITERDMLQFRNLELDLERLRASTVMSAPLFPIAPAASLWEAHQQMQRRRVHRLVVVGNEGELGGIITQTSLLQALDPMEMYAEIEVLQELLQQSESEREALLKQLIARNKLLESLALTDELTGLPNRRAMEQALPQMLPHSAAQETSVYSDYICLFAIDVDFFKRVNDTYGHPTGDEVLKEIAARLQRRARANSWFYRYGGEEFICLTVGIGPETAWEYGEELREAIAQEPFITAEGVPIPLTISIGGATAPLSGITAAGVPIGQDPQALLEFADRALYQAKREGRDRVQFCPYSEILCKFDPNPLDAR
jgi:diguanylate cyclase (GGDEF)-like protein